MSVAVRAEALASSDEVRAEMAGRAEALASSEEARAGVVRGN